MSRMFSYWVRRFSRGAAALLATSLLVWPARADPNPDDKALATALFNEARALMSDGRIGEACPKLQESHRLDPSGGTILNLALCHEQQGLFARSWSEFHEAASFARRDGRSDREQAAEQHVAALTPRLSRLTIAVPERARISKLRIERDGRELGEASWSIGMPVDGGEHTVRATAPDRQAFSAIIVIASESDTRTVEIPTLAFSPPRAAKASPAAGAPSAAPARPLPPPPLLRHGRTRQTIAWTTAGAGLLQWGAAGYFGVRAFQKHADSNSACPNAQCTAQGVAFNDQSRRAADASTSLAITGLVTLAASVYLFLTSLEGSEVAYSETPSGVAIATTDSTLVLQGRF